MLRCVAHDGCGVLPHGAPHRNPVGFVCHIIAVHKLYAARAFMTLMRNSCVSQVTRSENEINCAGMFFWSRESLRLLQDSCAVRPPVDAGLSRAHSLSAVCLTCLVYGVAVFVSTRPALRTRPMAHTSSV